jgi:hypothetical protein
VTHTWKNTIAIIRDLKRHELEEVPLPVVISLMVLPLGCDLPPAGENGVLRSRFFKGMILKLQGPHGSRQSAYLYVIYAPLSNACNKASPKTGRQRLKGKNLKAKAERRGLKGEG